MSDGWGFHSSTTYWAHTVCQRCARGWGDSGRRHMICGKPCSNPTSASSLRLHVCKAGPLPSECNPTHAQCGPSGCLGICFSFQLFLNKKFWCLLRKQKGEQREKGGSLFTGHSFSICVCGGEAVWVQTFHTEDEKLPPGQGPGEEGRRASAPEPLPPVHSINTHIFIEM